jgi:hypothetical protein
LPDYLEDTAFKSMWDPNPMFETEPEPKPKGRKPGVSR